MSGHTYKAAVLLLTFNRPDTTARVLEAIKAYAPKRLYWASDGPRPHKPGEAALVEQVQALQAQVDWPCEVRTLFREQNLGCRNAVTEAISWFFEQEEEGIVLEDDCLPHADFFRFCEAMLARYRHDERIGHIGGTNFQRGAQRGVGSYYYSKWVHIWGWASWRRVWQSIDHSLENLPRLQAEGYLQGLYPNAQLRAFWQHNLQAVHTGELDTWDYGYAFGVVASSRLAITPNANLVTNIGFDARATHTVSKDNALANVKLAPLAPPYQAPLTMLPNSIADDYSARYVFGVQGGVVGALRGAVKRLKRLVLG